MKFFLILFFSSFAVFSAEPVTSGAPTQQNKLESNSPSPVKKSSSMVYHESFAALREYDNYFWGIINNQNPDDYFSHKKYGIHWWEIMGFRYFFNKVDYSTLPSLRVPTFSNKSFEKDYVAIGKGLFDRKDEKGLRAMMNEYCKEQAQSYKVELAKIYDIKPDDLGMELYCEVFDKAMARIKILESDLYSIPNGHLLDSFDVMTFELQKLKLPSLIKRVQVLEDINKSVEDLGKRVEAAATDLKEIDRANKAMQKPVSIFEKVGMSWLQPIFLEVLVVLLLISNGALIFKIFIKNN